MRTRKTWSKLAPGINDLKASTPEGICIVCGRLLPDQSGSVRKLVAHIGECRETYEAWYQMEYHANRRKARRLAPSTSL